MEGLVSENLNNEANVIIGARINKEFQGKVRVITIMTGVKSPYVLGRDADEERKIPAAREMSDWNRSLEIEIKQK